MPKAFTVGDLRQLLMPMTLVRRKATMYCLETHTLPLELLQLRWQRVFNKNLPTLARDIVRSMPRHLRLDYVFWEYVPGCGGVVAPLFGLDETIMETTGGMRVAALQALYDRMIWVDPLAEVNSFQLVLATAALEDQ